MGENVEEGQEVPDVDVLAEEDVEEDDGEDSPAVRRSRSMNETWVKLVQEAKNVTVRQLTFVCPVTSRSVKHLLPALSRVYARLRALGLPLYRLHSDRAVSVLVHFVLQGSSLFLFPFWLKDFHLYV